MQTENTKEIQAVDIVASLFAEMGLHFDKDNMMQAKDNGLLVIKGYKDEIEKLKRTVEKRKKSTLWIKM